MHIVAHKILLKKADNKLSIVTFLIFKFEGYEFSIKSIFKYKSEHT